MGDDPIELFLLIGTVLLVIAFLLIFNGSIITIQVKKTQQKYHVPQGKITYKDLETCAKPMFSSRLYLTGKPDYIVKKKHIYLPVEVKSGQYHQPQSHHILQLAAYCALIEDTYHTFVPEGVLVYPTGHHCISFSPDLRFQLEKTIKEMKKNLHLQQIKRNHNNLQKCIACSLHQYCQEKLF